MIRVSMAIWLLLTSLFVACEESPNKDSSAYGLLYRDQTISHNSTSSVDSMSLDEYVNPNQDPVDSGLSLNDLTSQFDQRLSDTEDMDPSSDQGT